MRRIPDGLYVYFDEEYPYNMVALSDEIHYTPAQRATVERATCTSMTDEQSKDTEAAKDFFISVRLVSPSATR